MENIPNILCREVQSVVLVYHIRAQHALVYIDTGNIIIGFKAKGNSIQNMASLCVQIGDIKGCIRLIIIFIIRKHYISVYNHSTRIVCMYIYY